MGISAAKALFPVLLLAADERQNGKFFAFLARELTFSERSFIVNMKIKGCDCSSLAGS
jgi:hypothetical protein